MKLNNFTYLFGSMKANSFIEIPRGLLLLQNARYRYLGISVIKSGSSVTKMKLIAVIITNMTCLKKNSGQFHKTCRWCSPNNLSLSWLYLNSSLGCVQQINIVPSIIWLSKYTKLYHLLFSLWLEKPMTIIIYESNRQPQDMVSRYLPMCSHHVWQEIYISTFSKWKLCHCLPLGRFWPSFI